MIGQTISHYRIISKLGEGGMGVVYKAEDTKLKRTVALKFLPPELTRDPEAKARFVHEAQAASALDHPNVCNIHEIDETVDGQLFIAMACYEGKTLKEKIARGPLNLEEAVDLARQIAEGLAEAHGQEIVHRDLKPANVFVTQTGMVKILDFGLAKLAGQTKITQAGTTLGTVAYMSPEQARCEETDAKTDLWSLGVVLYEMVVGCPPFQGENQAAVIQSLQVDDPEPVTGMRTGVPLELERIIGKCLEKDPRGRFQTAADLLADLRRVRRELAGVTMATSPVRSSRGSRGWFRPVVGVVTTLLIVLIAAFVFDVAGLRTHLSGERIPSRITSLVVLPLDNLMNDPDQEYFVAGMHEALITELSKISALTVISRTSAKKYMDSDKSVPEIARELDVDAVVEGSVFRADSTVRVTAQLIEAETDRHLWAENFDRQLKDILTLHSEVARTIAHEIQVTLTPRDQIHQAGTQRVDPEAYDYYLKSQYLMQKHSSSKEYMEKIIEYLQRAIAIDPTYAQAYAKLAGEYLYRGYMGYLPPEEARAKAEPYLQKAMEIDDNLADVHVVLAGIKQYYEWDWAGAEKAYKRVIERNPGYVPARRNYSMLLAALGRSTEAIAEAKIAQRLDPLTFGTTVTLGNVYAYARHYEKAFAHYQRFAELEPKSGAYYALSRIYAFMGRYEDAIKAWQENMAIFGAAPEEIEALARAYSESGSDGYWKMHLEIMNDWFRNPANTAMYYAQLGDKDQAFAWLEKAYEKRDGYIFLLKVHPLWDPLRDDPRFHDLLRRMNLAE